jgi:hypothetical protein
MIDLPLTQQFDDRPESITSQIEHSELTAISDIDKIAVNSPNPARKPRQRDYIGCISPKTIKGITYQYWVWREKGKRHYRCMGTDRSLAVAKAKATYDPRM